MNKKTPLLLLAVVALTGCNKTKLLYGEHAYNFADFDKNYYVEWEDIKDLTISSSMEGFKSSVNSSINQTEDQTWDLLASSMLILYHDNVYIWTGSSLR